MQDLFNKINIKPINKNLYKQAFTHKSVSNIKKGIKTYETLEFLGDAILQMKSSLYIYNKFPKLNEGDMSLLRSKHVNTKSLAKISSDLNLGKYLILGNGAELLASNTSILADVYEALLAAIFLDLGQKEADAFLTQTLFIKINSANNIKDAKSTLQEFLQSESRESIVYNTVKLYGDFASTVTHDNQIFGKGKGKSKKEAEMNAAKKALSLLANKGET
jgi:ribonuclease-3